MYLDQSFACFVDIISDLNKVTHSSNKAVFEVELYNGRYCNFLHVCYKTSVHLSDQAVV